MKHINTLKLGLALGVSFLMSAAWNQATTFSYTGAPQTYTVPPGVTSLQVEVWGAQGQEFTIEQYAQSTGGQGGYAIGLLAVTPGEILNVYVGGMGTEDVAGFNGGGLGGYGTPSDGDAGRAGSGGGASDIRQGGAALANRVIVGGGGGGGGRDYVNGTCQPCGTGGNGGIGGGLIGGDGFDPADPIYASYFNPGAKGKGGTGVAGGAGGDGPQGPDGLPGALGVGGAGRDGSYSVASGGGGGGYYGGGSGAGANSGSGAAGAGGAGGSSYIGGVTDGSTTAGIRLGNGQVVITILCNALTVTVSDYSICLGDELTLDAESMSGAGITWDGGAIDEVAFTPGVTGTITYTATSDDDEDCPISVDIEVGDAPIVVAGAGDENFCDGEEVVLAASGSADVFSWDPTDLEPGIGSHTYTLTGVDVSTGCTNTDEVTITIHALPTVTASSDLDEVCEGNDIVLSGSGAETYVWSPADIEDGEDYNPGGVGTYTYTVIGTDENGCTDTDDVTVTVVEGITVSAVVTEEVMGDDGAIDLTITGGVAPYTIDWSNDGTGDFDDTEDLTGLSEGFYEVVVNGSTGCSATLLVNLGSQLGTDELNAMDLTVYPNPTTNFVTIQSAGTFNYELTSINGDIVMAGTAVNQKLVNMSELANGVYFAKVSSVGQSATVKIVKQ